MNRVIKFRGKRIDSREWLYGDLHHLGSSRYSVMTVCESEQGDTLAMNGVYPETVGQFTGLCDTKGREIYEGDIVKYFNCYADGVVYDLTAEVTANFGVNENGYPNTCFELSLISGPAKMTKGCAMSWFHSKKQFEVIGNIFDDGDSFKGY